MFNFNNSFSASPHSSRFEGSDSWLHKRTVTSPQFDSSDSVSSDDSKSVQKAFVIRSCSFSDSICFVSRSTLSISLANFLDCFFWNLILSCSSITRSATEWFFCANLHARREKNWSLPSLKITRFLTDGFFPAAKG